MKDTIATKSDAPRSKRLARKTNSEIQAPAGAEQLLSRRAVAARHGVSVETIKRRERAGLLKPMRFSLRLIRYKLSDVLAYEESASGAEQ